MAERETHFELFLRKSPKASWVLADAYADRAAAIAQAKKLLRPYPNGGIRVLKEVRGQNNAYKSVTVATFGDCEEPRQGKSRAIIPQSTSSCMSPADLSTPAARKTYIEVIPRFLERNRVLPGELVYRTDLLEQLEASGSEITQAIQKVAISRSEGDDLHKIVRQLHELVNQAVNKVFSDNKSGLFVSYGRNLAETIDACRSTRNPKLAFGAALADKLKKAMSWPEKLNGLISIWREAEDLPDEDRKFVNKLLSDYFAEWIEMPGAMKAILGDTECAGEIVDRLIAILEPDPAEMASARRHNILNEDGEEKLIRDPLSTLPAARQLAEAVAMGLLPSARQTIITRIFSEISSNQRLYETCLQTEFDMLKDFGDRLVRVLNSSRRSEMYDAFCARSKRLMSTDTVDAYLEQFDVMERPERLLDMEDNLVGADARNKMASLIRGIMGQPRFESMVLQSDARHLQTLITLRSTQMKLLGSTLPEQDRMHCAQDIDALAVRLISNSNIFRTVARKAGTPALAAVSLFRLAVDALPRGQSATLASLAATKMLRDESVLGAVREDEDLRNTIKSLSVKAKEAGTLQKQASVG